MKLEFLKIKKLKLIILNLVKDMLLQFLELNMNNLSFIFKNIYNIL